MKNLVSIILFAVVIPLTIVSCGPSEEERAEQLIKQCNERLEDPILNAYFSEAYIRGHKKLVIQCGKNVGLLESEYDNILDKVAEAHAQYTIDKAMNANQ